MARYLPGPEGSMSKFRGEQGTKLSVNLNTPSPELKLKMPTNSYNAKRRTEAENFSAPWGYPSVYSRD